MRVLIVGAGAVGQVYGRHLSLGGAVVDVFVKPKYADEARAGFVLYPLNQGVVPVRWAPSEVLTSAEDVAARRYDQVWLCISATALRGEGIGPLLAASGEAVIVNLVPGVEASDRVASHVGADRVASGLISLISYEAPLPGETRFPEPGTAYWFPPLGPSPFSGPGADVVVATLKKGGQPAKVAADVGKTQGVPAALMTAYLLALEACGWKLDALAANMADADAAGREALAIVTRQLDVPMPGWARLMRPWLLRAGLALARRIIPLPLEIYLEVHFTKVHDQTLMFVDDTIAAGHAQGQSTATLEALRARVA